MLLKELNNSSEIHPKYLKEAEYLKTNENLETEVNFQIYLERRETILSNVRRMSQIRKQSDLV